MKIRPLPWWFVLAMLIGIAGFTGGIALLAHGLAVHRAHVAQTPTEDLPPSFPDPLPPAGPEAPGVPEYTPPPIGGRPRSTPTRPAASAHPIPTPYRSMSPSAAPSRTGSPTPSRS